MISGWMIIPTQQHKQHHQQRQVQIMQRSSSTTTTELSMGILDSLSNFLSDREGDFVKLDKDSSKEYGPGPVVLLYGIPNGIDDDEFQDMLSDGAPTATQKGITLKRIAASSSKDDDDVDTLLSLSLREALDTVVKEAGNQNQSQSQSEDNLLSTDAGILATTTPVLLFSGFLDSEMLDSYNIMGQQIYEETGGQQSTACAKAVENAMEKPLRQVLKEISGDHQEAMKG